jgi:hypothetical protein
MFALYWVFAPSRLADGAEASCGVEVPGVEAPPDVPALLCGELDTVPVPAVEPVLARLLDPELPVDEVSAPAGAGAVFTELEADGIELPDELALPLPARTELPVPAVSEAAGAAALDDPAPEPPPPVEEPDIVAVDDDAGGALEDDLLPEDELLSPQAPSARRPTIAVAARRCLPISLLPSCNIEDHAAKKIGDAGPCTPKNGSSYEFIPMQS